MKNYYIATQCPKCLEGRLYVERIQTVCALCETKFDVYIRDKETGVIYKKFSI